MSNIPGVDIPRTVLEAISYLDRANGYCSGYKDAVESTALAMHRAGVDEVTMLEVVLTAVDALGNNA